MVRAYQKGQLHTSSKQISDAAHSMSIKDVKDFATTKHDGLPEHVKDAASIHDPFSDESPSFPTFFGSDEFAGHQAKRQAALKSLLTSPSLKQRFGLLLAGGRKNYRNKQWNPQPETSSMADKLNDLYAQNQMQQAGVHQPNSRGEPTPITMNAQESAALKHLMSLYASGGEFDFKKKANCTSHDPNIPESFDRRQKPLQVKKSKKAFFAGFAKAAAEAGFTPGQTLDFLQKKVAPSWMEPYLPEAAGTAASQQTP